MSLPWKCTMSNNPKGKCYSGVDKETQNMDNFMNYVKTIVYPNGKAYWHILNKYFCSRFNEKTEYFNALYGFQMFHE